MSATAEVQRARSRKAAPAGAPASRPERTHPPRPAPDPERLARAVAHAFLEVEAGRRPLSQLDPVLAPALRERLRGTTRRPGPGPTGNAVVAVRGDWVGDRAYDAAVVVSRGERCGVIALRLERHRAAWRVVELARPEDRRA